MIEVHATGIWCKDCEFFEDGDNLTSGSCRGCGCSSESHVTAQVVST